MNLKTPEAKALGVQRGKQKSGLGKIGSKGAWRKWGEGEKSVVMAELEKQRQSVLPKDLSSW